jgi:hypothetical protein
MWVKALTNIQHGRNKTIRAGSAVDLKDENLLADLFRAGAIEKISGEEIPAKLVSLEEIFDSIAKELSSAGVEDALLLPLAEKVYWISRDAATEAQKEPEPEPEPEKSAKKSGKSK